METLSYFENFSIVKELLNLILQLFTAFLQIVGIVFVVQALNYTAQQIKHSEQTHADSLEWNRKKATDEILELKPDREVTKRLNDVFQTINSKNPIKDFEEKIENHEGLELDIHHLLNVYERLSRGMKNDIYVEEIVKESLLHVFIKIYDNYSLYITQRRTVGNPRAWSIFEKYVLKWKEEEEKENH